MASEEGNFFATLFERRELLSTLVRRNLIIRYKGSALGFFWSLLTPAIFILIYAVFAGILKFNHGNHYLQFLVAGIIVWQFTVSCLNDSLHAIVGNSNLVKKVFFPRIILPVSTAFANAVNFFLTFVVLIVFLLVTGTADFHAAWWLIPAFLMQIALCVGLCCLCSISNVFFRDTQHIVGVVSQAWFFMSPVMYGIDLQLGFLPESLRSLAYLNPMAGILAAYRAGLMGDPVVPGGWQPVAISACVCLIVFLAGLKTVRSYDAKLGDVL